METCAFINGEFINLYTKDNPILETGDVCYGLIFNTIDYHMPLIVKGIVKFDKFCNGMNKQYYIRVLEIVQSPKVIQEFFVGKSFSVHPCYSDICDESTIQSKKTIQITNHFDFNTYLFKLEAFFVRNSEQKILELQSEYIDYIQKDLKKMIQDTEMIHYE